MARNATSAGSQQITGTYPQLRNQSKFSYSYFYNRSTNNTLQVAGVSQGSGNITSIYHWSDNVIYAQVETGALAYGSINKSGVVGWNHLALVFDGTQSTNATRLKAYFNGLQQALTFVGTIPNATANTSNAEIFRVNNWNNTTFGNGSYAEIGMWQEVLSNSDVAALANGMTPDKVRPDKLFSYIPLVRDIQDVKSGTTLTNTNTTVANHPRVYA